MSLTNGNGTKLIGKDSRFYRAAIGAEVLGDASTALPDGTYLIINVAAISTFPPTAGGGTAAAAGDVLVIDGVTVTPAVDDDVATLTLTALCDISSWTMEFTKEEVDVTTLCDLQKKYRAGKADMAGTAEGIFKMGTTDDPTNGFLRQFIDIVQQDGSTSFDRYVSQDEILLGFFYVNYDTSIGDQMYVVAPFQLFVNSLGGASDAAQGFSGSFRFSDFAYTVLAGSGAGNDVSIEPTFYRLGS
jgi:hypothetical protein